MAVFSVSALGPPRYSIKGDVKRKDFSSELDRAKFAWHPAHPFTLSLSWLWGESCFALPVTDFRFLLSLVGEVCSERHGVVKGAPLGAALRTLDGSVTF
jgi:hypothetical protein